MIRRSPNNFKQEWLVNLATADIDNLSRIVEDKIEQYAGVKYCSLTCNGTAAIYLGMLELNLKKGDEIILPDFGYWAVKICAEQLGLNIKYVDVKYDTMCLDPEKVKESITSNTKAICFVNHLGYVGEDILMIKAIAEENDIIFFEDSAQSFGQTYKGISAGTNGIFGIYSFSGTKLLRTGEGGCLITNNKEMRDSIGKNKNMGIMNFIMSDLCSSLLNSQLDDIDDIIYNRSEIYKRYNNLIEMPCPYTSDKFIGFNNIVYKHPKAMMLFKLLTNQNIECRYNYYKSFSNKPVAKKLVNDYIELPSDNNISDENIENIVKTIKIICR